MRNKIDYILDDFQEEIRHVEEGANLGEYESRAAELADIEQAEKEVKQRFFDIISETINQNSVWRSEDLIDAIKPLFGVADD